MYIGCIFRQEIGQSTKGAVQTLLGNHFVREKVPRKNPDAKNISKIFIEHFKFFGTQVPFIIKHFRHD
jgi:hypothetical protein